MSSPSGDGEWNFVTKLNNSNDYTDDYFGRSLALYDDIITIGAASGIYIYQKSSDSSEWELIGDFEYSASTWRYNHNDIKMYDNFAAVGDFNAFTFTIYSGFASEITTTTTTAPSNDPTVTIAYPTHVPSFQPSSIPSNNPSRFGKITPRENMQNGENGRDDTHTEVENIHDTTTTPGEQVGGEKQDDNGDKHDGSEDMYVEADQDDREAMATPDEGDNA